MHILITGGSGFAGEPLVRYLRDAGHQITLLSRGQHKNAGVDSITYPKDNERLQPEKVAEFHAVINLAGASIASTRWNKNGKKLILDSRIQVTRLLTESITNNQILGLPYPKIFISTSAIGYYGTSDSATFDETSPNGSGFLSEVALQWEKQASQIEALGIRLIILRFAIVLGKGGILEQLRKPFDYRMGGFVGTGKQWISWIHLRDLIHVIDWALQTEKASGIYNACAPNPSSMKELTSALANTIHHKSWTRLPEFLARMIFGEMADELILHGQRAFPKRLQEEGFHWKYCNISEALENIFEKDKSKISL